jgi:NAD(P)-dependent dehydrogenase (short-subunit alcohol dehydrogenase family)
MIVDRPGSKVREVAEALTSARSEHNLAWAECDLSESTGVQDMFAALDERLGGLEMLIACAGVGSGPLMEMSEPEWRYVIESNLLSYVASTQGAIQRIRASGAPDCLIVLVGSISVHIKAVGESVYNAAKGGVASFAETLRKELMHEGIRLTLIEPGAIGSAMQPFPEDERTRFVEQHEMLSPTHVADAIMFAATRPAGVDVVTLRIEPQVQKIS